MRTVVHDGSEPDAPSGSTAGSPPPDANVRDGARRLLVAALQAAGAYVTTPAAARYLSIIPGPRAALSPPVISAG